MARAYPPLASPLSITNWTETRRIATENPGKTTADSASERNPARISPESAGTACSTAPDLAAVRWHGLFYGASRAGSWFCLRRSEEMGRGEHTHFLDACFLCRKPLAGNRDIFMYRGDTPFCSEECRREQMEADEAAERRETARAGKLTRGAPPHREVEGPQERSSSVRAGSILAL